MKKLFYLDVVDLYIFAMLGRGHARQDIATALKLCHPAVSNRIRKIRDTYPDYFNRVGNIEQLTPDGFTFSKVCFNSLQLLTDIQEPVKVCYTKKDPLF